MGGIPAYAELLQATLDTLVKLTAGDGALIQTELAGQPPGMVRLARPVSHTIKYFCIQASQQQGESLCAF